MPYLYHLVQTICDALNLLRPAIMQAAVDEGCFRQSGNIFEGAPDVSRILTIATQIASAMDYLHARVRCLAFILYSCSHGHVWLANQWLAPCQLQIQPVFSMDLYRQD